MTHYIRAGDSGIESTKVTEDSAEQCEGRVVPAHLALGSPFQFRINILQVGGISSEYCDVYLQFK